MKKKMPMPKKKLGPKHPVLSVVVPTYNRLPLLTLLLDSLVHLKIPLGHMEVIVSDDGSTDGTARALALRNDPFQLSVIRAERSSGPAAARNRGAQAARGSVLGFLDSDVTVAPAWWSAAAGHFKDTAVAAVEGATDAPPGSPREAGVFDHVVSNRKGGNYLTCNMFYRRDVFLRLGGFDERYLRANREDSDFAFTVLDQGERIVFEPECRVWHPVMRGRKTQFVREARFGYHEALLRRKHPALYRQKLKWIDGRAFPVFYWGFYIGVPALLSAWALGCVWSALAASVAIFLGWTGSVYAVCRKRRVLFSDLMFLIPQYFIIPWLRLGWVLAGEWKFRNIKPTALLRKERRS